MRNYLLFLATATALVAPRPCSADYPALRPSAERLLQRGHVVLRLQNVSKTVLEYLETVEVARERAFAPLRLPVQTVLRPNLDYRGFAGQIASGTVQVGDEVIVRAYLPRSPGILDR